MAAHVYPAEKAVAEWDADAAKRWTSAPIIETLKNEAKKAGLWNLFLPDKTHGAGLSNLDYAPLAEQMGRVLWASGSLQLQCTGHRQHGVACAFRERRTKIYLASTPLLKGEIRSAFAMTEPGVASSDATNIALRIHADGR